MFKLWCPWKQQHQRTERLGKWIFWADRFNVLILHDSVNSEELLNPSVLNRPHGFGFNCVCQSLVVKVANGWQSCSTWKKTTWICNVLFKVFKVFWSWPQTELIHFKCLYQVHNAHRLGQNWIQTTNPLYLSYCGLTTGKYHMNWRK